MTGLYANRLPDDVRETVRVNRLRIETPILEYVMSKQTRRHLASMDPERLAKLQADWADGEAANSISEPISPEIKALADKEWNEL